MYVDLFYACKEAFLITKVLPLGHTMITALDKTDTTSLRRALRVHLGTYGQRRTTITSLYSDNERGITAMASLLSSSCTIVRLMLKLTPSSNLDVATSILLATPTTA